MKKLLITIGLVISGYTGASAQCSGEVLQAFGATSAMAMYNTYVTIGSVADAYNSSAYEASYVKQLMDEQLVFLGNVRDYLDKAVDAKESGLSDDDIKYMKEMNECLGYLEDEAEGLKEFAETASDKSRDKYSKGREKSWAMIEELLGLNGEE